MKIKTYEEVVTHLLNTLLKNEALKELRGL